MTRDRQCELVIQTKAKRLCVEPPCGIRLLTGIKTTWVRQGHLVRRKDMAFSGYGARAFGKCQRDLEKAVQYQQIQPEKCCPGLQCLLIN